MSNPNDPAPYYPITDERSSLMSTNSMKDEYTSLMSNTTPDQRTTLIQYDDTDDMGEQAGAVTKAINTNSVATVGSSILNLTNTILGAGMLGLPYALSKCGLPLGLSLFGVFGFLSGCGLHFLSAVGRQIPDVSFTKASQATMPVLKTIVDLAVAIKCFGVGSSYLIVAGDLIPRVVDAALPSSAAHREFWLNRRIWISIVCLTCVVPIVRFPKMDSLKFASSIALCCLAYVVVVVFLFAFIPNKFHACTTKNPNCTTPVSFHPQKAMEFMSIIPIFIFGFTCHQNAFTITNELRNPTQNRLNRVILVSIGVCIVVYCFVSYAGYKTYGNLVASDILNNYPESMPITILRALLSFSLGLSYPLQCHPCRKCLSQVIFRKEASDLDWRRFYGLTYSITFGSWALAMVVKDLGIVLAFVGATGSTAISYILPGMFYYKFFKSGTKRYGALALCIMGCCIVPFAVTIVALSGAKGG